MNKLASPKLLVLLFISCIFLSSCNVIFTRSASKRAEKQMAGPARSDRKVKESRKVRRTIKKQERKQLKLKKDYQKFVKQSRKRSYEIQSPEVKARMKQNEADIARREKANDKRTKAASRSRARKFR